MFRLAPKAKVPLKGSHGHKDATTDPETIRKWWTERPDANLGLRTGRESGLIVIESDPKNGGSFEKFEAAYGRSLSPTRTIRSGSGGVHRYYGYPTSVISTGALIEKIPCVIGELHPGIDVKADAGYVVAPPSIHPNGRTYEVIDDVPVAEIPDWLVHLILFSGKANGAKKRVKLADGEKLNQGRRDNAVFGEASAYRAIGMPEEGIRAAIGVYNQLRCDPPLPEADLDRIASSAAEYEPNAKGSQADKLAAMIEELNFDLFRDQNHEPYVMFNVQGHAECAALNSSRLKNYLTQVAYLKTGKVPGPDAVHSIVNLLSAQAFEKPCREVFVRFGHADGKSYLDLCNDEWSVVEVDSTGWRVLDHSPIPFRRSTAMKALPTPTRNGRIDDLFPCLNATTSEDRVIFVSWLLSTFLAPGTFPILLISGLHGSAKSGTATCLRRLIDDNALPLNAPPRDERDLSIALNNSAVGAYDNLSSIPDWLSDAVCRVASGGGFRTRKLTTDSEESLFTGRRSMVINGIDDVASRPDLLDRCICVNLSALEEFKTTSEIDVLFERVRPGVLGALLDAVSRGLRQLPSTRIELPRMADFARWIVACEPALADVSLCDGEKWEPGTFLKTYEQNHQAAIDGNIDDDLFATSFLVWALQKTVSGVSYEMSPSSLLGEVQALRPADYEEDFRTANDKRWPRSADAMGRRLRRLIPSLSTKGISITVRRPGGARLYNIERISSQKETNFEEETDNARF